MNLGARCRIELQESKRLLERMSSSARKALTEQGRYLRTVAQRSISTKGGVSQPGHPPRSITGLLRDFLLWKYDPVSASVVVGPALLTGVKNHLNPTIPEILESGGTEIATVKRGKEWKKMQVTIAPRPYMAPALVRSQAKLNEIWANSLV